MWPAESSTASARDSCSLDALRALDACQISSLGVRRGSTAIEPDRNFHPPTRIQNEDGPLLVTIRSTVITFAALILTACAQQMPLISHAHMGHSLTAWHDTPDNEPLLVVAEKELVIALREIDLAIAAPGSDERRERVANALHAINPDFQPAGVGLGYGAIRATEATLDHLEFAAGSEDASNNLVQSVSAIATPGERVILHLRAAQTSADLALRGSDNVLAARAEEVREQLQLAALGDGEFHGLDGIRTAVETMLERETDPRYEPLPRRYVLGLVRLPNGRWGYRLPRRQSSFRSAGYGSYSY